MHVDLFPVAVALLAELCGHAPATGRRKPPCQARVGVSRPSAAPISLYSSCTEGAAYLADAARETCRCWVGKLRLVTVKLARAVNGWLLMIVSTLMGWLPGVCSTPMPTTASHRPSGRGYAGIRVSPSSTRTAAAPGASIRRNSVPPRGTFGVRTVILMGESAASPGGSTDSPASSRNPANSAVNRANRNMPQPRIRCLWEK